MGEKNQSFEKSPLLVFLVAFPGEIDSGRARSILAGAGCGAGTKAEPAARVMWNFSK